MATSTLPSGAVPQSALHPVRRHWGGTELRGAIGGDFAGRVYWAAAFSQDFWLLGEKRMSRLFEVEFSFLSYLPVSSSCCLFLLFWTKHGFEVKWREKLPSGTLPIVRAWRKTTKTKRRKLALKRRKMALKQHKFLAETRKQQKQHFFSKQHFSLQTAKIITSLGNDTFSIFVCSPGCYRS